jgi:hypothetical protein
MQNFTSLHQNVMKGRNETFNTLPKTDKTDVLGQLWMAWCQSLGRRGSWRQSTYGTGTCVHVDMELDGGKRYSGHIEEDGRVFDSEQITSKWNIVTNQDRP